MNEPKPAGTRGRIVEPSPAAPVPQAPSTLSDSAQREQELQALDRSKLTAAPGSNAEAQTSAAPEASETSDAQVVRSTGSMAIATLLSRITGFIRTLLITTTLGGAVGSAFTVANTLPNMITEIVLGSVLTALVVPVLTRAEKEDPDRGAAFIRRLFTITLALMTVVTVAAVAAAPWLTRIQLRESGEVNVELATNFAYLLLPQIFFYGMFSLFMAILNTKEVFRPGAWAPVINNLVTIAVLVVYSFVPGSINPAAPSSLADVHVLLIGLGTTAGVVVQCAIMLPPLFKAGIDLRPLWGIDPRLKQFAGMAAAIVVYVAISQIGLTVTNNIASISDKAAPLIYSNHWLILQVPYGVIGVALLTAIMPRLSRNAADGDDRAVVRDLTVATKLTFIALIPIVIFFTFYGPQIGQALFGYANFDDESAYITGLTIAFSAFTLIPYALVMLHLRVFYAREEAWTPTFIIAGITGTKIALSLVATQVVTQPAYVVVLLGAANGFGFVTGAVIGAQLLRRKLGSLGMRSVLRTSIWATAASLIGVAAALSGGYLLRFIASRFFSWISSLSSISSLAYLVELLISGIIFLIVTGIVLAFSRLPEVQTLGKALNRIPGMSRFLRPDEEHALDPGPTTPVSLSQQLVSQDIFTSTPVPPPMSAGVVRGPRLVPGAPVSDGRFRLLKNHGSVSGSMGADFWQAIELSTAKHVSLTFVDTTGSAPMAPLSPTEAARRAAEVTQRTRELSELEQPALPTNIRVLRYRSGCLIVADWVQGTPLRDLTTDTQANSQAKQERALLNPHAVALAMTPLAEATAHAADTGTPLGLDNASRLRVSTEGAVVLAFPAVLGDASPEHDAAGLASALELLTSATARSPEGINSTLAQIAYDARAVANESATEDTVEKLRDIASRLLSFGLPSTRPTERKEIIREGLLEPAKVTTQAAKTPTPETAEPGFGSRGYSSSGTALLVTSATVLVIAVAGATTYLTGILSGDSRTAPINADSIQGSQVQQQPRQLPTPQTIDRLSVWHAPGSDYLADNPQQADLAADGDFSTSWRSDSYPAGLGEKPGFGLALTTKHPVRLREIELAAAAAGAELTVYHVPEGVDPHQLVSLEGLTPMKELTIDSGRTTVDLAVNTPFLPPTAGFILWFSALPDDADFIEISEINVLGTNPGNP